MRSFGIFYLGNNIFHLDPDTLRTIVYLNLSVGGHLTLFVSRTRHNFWTINPARVLLLAVVGTQIIATFIAVYGFLMAPLGWYYAGIVWGYCLVLFVIQDWVKLAAYKIFGEEHSGYFGRHAKSDTA